MADSILDRLARLSAGKRTKDIELPNESGKRDPRLPAAEEPVGKRMLEGWKLIQSHPLLGSKNKK